MSSKLTASNLNALYLARKRFIDKKLRGVLKHKTRLLTSIIYQIII